MNPKLLAKALSIVMLSFVPVIGMGGVARSQLPTMTIQGGQTPEISKLIQQLKTGNENERYSAHIALASLGQAAVPSILPLLKDSDLYVRRYALSSLNLMKNLDRAPIAPTLLGLFNDQDENMRLMAASGISKMGQDAIPLVIPRLKDPNPLIRWSSVHVFYFIEQSAKAAAMPALTPLLEDPDDRVRLAAANTFHREMGQLGEPAIPSLINLLKDKKTEVKREAAFALANMGKSAKLAVPSLVPLLKDQDTWVRRAAIQALGKIVGEAGLGDREVLGHLQKIITMESDSWVQGDAVRAIANLAKVDKSVLLDFVQLLESQNNDIQQEVVSQLWAMGPSAKEAIPLLERYLQIPVLQTSAAIAMGNMGPDAKKAIPVLTQLLKHPDRTIQGRAVQALANMGESANDEIPKLVALLDTKDFFVYLDTVRALAKMGEKAKAAIPKLTEQLQSPDPWIQFYAANALRQLNREQVALPTLIKLLGNPNYYIFSSATVALSKIGKPAQAAVPYLVPLLKSEYSSIRRDAASALVQIDRSPKVIQALVEFLKDPDPLNRVIAAQSLAQGGELKVAIPQLVELIQHRRSDIRSRAIDALVEIREPHKMVIPELIPLLQNQDPDVRSTAAAALKKLGYKP